MRPGDEPKYLNSPETAAYTKGRHLFGLSVSRDEIRRKKFAILVEGYLDLIVPFQHGVRNAVASLGTDRKSTRLNSSHANISYAVFCLKKKKPAQSRSGTRSRMRIAHPRPPLSVR